MKECPFCKEQIHDDATRCRYCSASLAHVEGESSAKGEQIIYVVDRGLVRFAKFALTVLAIFALVGAFLYGFKIEQAAEKVNDAKEQTAKARDETSKAKAEAQAIKETVATHQESIIAVRKQISEDADKAKDILRQIRLYEQEAKIKLTLIEAPRITDQQIRDAVDRVLLSRLKDVLSPGQLAKFTTPIEAEPTPLSELLDQPALKLINASDAIALVTDGAEIRVAIVADAVALDLPQFKHRIVPGETDTTQDPSGDHGTAVASLIAAIAPKAQLLPLPALTATGGGTDEVVSRAIRRAADAEARIICMPLGGLAPSNVQHEAVKYAHDRGALLIAPDGNTAFGGQTPQKSYPAAYDEVLCVASTNNEDKRASFSGYGDWVDLAAPGEAIRVLTSTGETTVMDGGSFSAAILAGVVALMLSERPNLSPEKVTQMLRNSSVPVDPSVGGRRVDAAAAVRAVKSSKG